MTVRILLGDCRERLRELPDASVNCCVTSPPYFGLRDYGHAGQMGLEPTPDEFVAGMVEVFREVRRVLRDDGTLWLNIGDSYSASAKGSMAGQDKSGLTSTRTQEASPAGIAKDKLPGIKTKDLIGIPWMLAFALRADGWYLRQDIIWSKPNPMPESVRDRCTKAHEYMFLLSKSPRYYFDQDAIAEPIAAASVARLLQNIPDQVGSERVPGKTNGAMKAVSRGGGPNAFRGNGANRPERDMSQVGVGTSRNKRSVWEIATQPFSEAHFATYPPALIEPCILAGCPKGGAVLDPFGGAGTTGMVADRLGRDAILIELNPEYAEIARHRLASDGGMFADVKVAA
ncbi:MAG: site-specific DNA-methyltransferase [Pseudomonadota bacterium]